MKALNCITVRCGRVALFRARGQTWHARVITQPFQHLTVIQFRAFIFKWYLILTRESWQVMLDGTVGTVVVTTMPMTVAGVNQPNWTWSRKDTASYWTADWYFGHPWPAMWSHHDSYHGMVAQSPWRDYCTDIERLAIRWSLGCENFSPWPDCCKTGPCYSISLIVCTGFYRMAFTRSCVEILE